MNEPIVDPFLIAEAWGLQVVEGSASLARPGVITVRRGCELRRRFDVAHELGHIVAEHTGLDARCERTASGIAAATLMPDAAFKRDLSCYEWDIESLAPAYGVSYRMAARRISELRGAVVSEWNGSSLSRRWRSPWLTARGFSTRHVPDWERDLASFCASYECHLLENDGQVRAYWCSGTVFLVSEVEAWEKCSTSTIPRW